MRRQIRWLLSAVCILGVNAISWGQESSDEESGGESTVITNFDGFVPMSLVDEIAGNKTAEKEGSEGGSEESSKRGDPEENESEGGNSGESDSGESDSEESDSEESDSEESDSEESSGEVSPINNLDNFTPTDEVFGVLGKPSGSKEEEKVSESSDSEGRSISDADKKNGLSIESTELDQQIDEILLKTSTNAVIRGGLGGLADLVGQRNWAVLSDGLEFALENKQQQLVVLFLRLIGLELENKRMDSLSTLFPIKLLEKLVEYVEQFGKTVLGDTNADFNADVGELQEKLEQIRSWDNYLMSSHMSFVSPPPKAQPKDLKGKLVSLPESKQEETKQESASSADEEEDVKSSLVRTCPLPRMTQRRPPEDREVVISELLKKAQTIVSGLDRINYSKNWINENTGQFLGAGPIESDLCGKDIETRETDPKKKVYSAEELCSEANRSLRIIAVAEANSRIARVGTFRTTAIDGTWAEYNVPGVGNCMFHAIAHQLGVLGITRIKIDDVWYDCDYITLRMLAAEQIQNAPDYQNFLAGNDEDEVNMGQMGVYGGHIALQALADRLGITIRVVDSTSRESEILTQITPSDKAIDNPPLQGTTITIRHINGNHYHSLVKLENYGLKELVTEALESLGSTLPDFGKEVLGKVCELTVPREKPVDVLVNILMGIIKSKEGTDKSGTLEALDLLCYLADVAVGDRWLFMDCLELLEKLSQEEGENEDFINFRLDYNRAKKILEYSMKLFNQARNPINRNRILTIVGKYWYLFAKAVQEFAEAVQELAEAVQCDFSKEADNSLNAAVLDAEARYLDASFAATDLDAKKQSKLNWYNARKAAEKGNLRNLIDLLENIRRKTRSRKIPPFDSSEPLVSNISKIIDYVNSLADNCDSVGAISMLQILRSLQQSVCADKEGDGEDIKAEHCFLKAHLEEVYQFLMATGRRLCGNGSKQVISPWLDVKSTTIKSESAAESKIAAESAVALNEVALEMIAEFQKRKFSRYPLPFGSWSAGTYLSDICVAEDLKKNNFLAAWLITRAFFRRGARWVSMSALQAVRDQLLFMCNHCSDHFPRENSLVEGRTTLSQLPSKKVMALRGDIAVFGDLAEAGKKGYISIAPIEDFLYRLADIWYQENCDAQEPEEAPKPDDSERESKKESEKESEKKVPHSLKEAEKLVRAVVNGEKIRIQGNSGSWFSRFFPFLS